jgi:hypothetical protein
MTLWAIRMGSSWAQRQVVGELGAESGCAREGDGAAVCFRDRPHDEQIESGALPAAVGRAREPFEDPFLVGLGDAGTGDLDGQCDVPSTTTGLSLCVAARSPVEM